MMVFQYVTLTVFLCRDHLGREEQLALQVLSAHLDDLDLRGPLDLQEKKECQ